MAFFAVDPDPRALNEFAHFGRHEGYPTRHISWAEARFGLVSTLAVFDLLTNRQHKINDKTEFRSIAQLANFAPEACGRSRPGPLTYL